jgi:hypothetical protein
VVASSVELEDGHVRCRHGDEEHEEDSADGDVDGVVGGAA